MKFFLKTKKKKTKYLMARARSEILRNTKVSVRGQNTEEKKKGVEAWAGLIEKC